MNKQISDALDKFISGANFSLLHPLDRERMYDIIIAIADDSPHEGWLLDNVLSRVEKEPELTAFNLSEDSPYNSYLKKLSDEFDDKVHFFRYLKK